MWLNGRRGFVSHVPFPNSPEVLASRARDMIQRLGPERTAPASTTADPDWPALFREAGLDVAEFKRVAPTLVSREESDAPAAWTGPGADRSGSPLRVEAAAYGGRPVFFRLIPPWAPAGGGTTRPAGPSVQGTVNAVLSLVLILSAIVLALRNVRLGRVDTRAATRLAPP